MAIVIKRTAADGTTTSNALQATAVVTPTLPPTHQILTKPKAGKGHAKAGVVKPDKDSPSKNSLAHALSFSANPLPPVEGYSLLDALLEFSENKYPKKVLRIVHKTLTTHSYKVKEYNHSSGRAKLESEFKGGILKPVITEREGHLYIPRWEDK